MIVVLEQLARRIKKKTPAKIRLRGNVVMIFDIKNESFKIPCKNNTLIRAKPQMYLLISSGVNPNARNSSAENPISSGSV